MQISKQAGQYLLLGAAIMLVLPMIVFPQQFGSELVKPSLMNHLYELVFYGLILYLFNRHTNLVKLFQGAIFCLVYRLAVGLALGIVITVAYSMKFTISTQLAMASYMPAVLFHILLTPLVMREFLLPRLLATGTRSQRSRPKRPSPSSTPGRSSMISSASRDYSRPTQELTAFRRPNREPISRQLSPGGVGATEINGFDRAVKYIGEHGSVYMAAVVDNEGLLLAQFKRGKFIPEDYAPLAQLLTDDNSRSIYRHGFDFSELERIDLSLKDEKVVVFRHDFCTLVVIAERQSDDLLNIRINQGIDTIAKYVEDRYPRTKTSNVENRYVPGTK
jgi:predicted regulator of Ras-like GTPase activity (Roadblock/LC7/MglB family)